MNIGGNGPVTRNEVLRLFTIHAVNCAPYVIPLQGMYNNYGAIHAFWSDTTDMDNLRGGDATGKATPGAMEVDSKTHTGYGNTVHTYSGDGFYKPVPPTADTVPDVTPCAIQWPTPPALLNARTQECVSLAETYCTVACVTWGHMSDPELQTKWTGGGDGTNGESCDCQLRVALNQGSITDGTCQACPTYSYTGTI